MAPISSTTSPTRPPPSDAPPATIMSFLANSVRASLDVAVHLCGCSDDYGVRINQQALAKLLNLDQPAQ